MELTTIFMHPSMFTDARGAAAKIKEMVEASESYSPDDINVYEFGDGTAKVTLNACGNSSLEFEEDFADPLQEILKECGSNAIFEFRNEGDAFDDGLDFGFISRKGLKYADIAGFLKGVREEIAKNLDKREAMPASACRQGRPFFQ